MTTTRPVGEPAVLPAAVRDLLVARGFDSGTLRFAAPSTTRLDTGRWLRGGQVWVLVGGDRLVLAAAGPRPTLITLPLGALSDAVYNHVTGELGFPPVASGPRIPPVQLDPLLARALLALARVPASTSPGNPPDA